MMNKVRPSDDELMGLITQPHFDRKPSVIPPSTDPITPTPMLVEIEQIEPYDRNPRRVENAAFDQIKESIRMSGMDQTLTITRRPGADRYMISAGGNTRLKAVQQLWRETGDTRFKQVHCLFKPWASDAEALVAHLKENDLRGDLVFIERALAIRDLRELIESESGSSLSLRGLEAKLKERGYQVSTRLIGWFDYAVDVLYPAIPTALQAGMGRPQIERLRDLERAFATVWEALDLGPIENTSPLFAEVLSRHDDEVIDLDVLRRDLEAELSVSADCDIQRASLLFGAACDGRSAAELRNEAATSLSKDADQAWPTQAPHADLATALDDLETTEAGDPSSAVVSHLPDIGEHIELEQDAPNDPAPFTGASINKDVERSGDIDQLRERACVIARSIADRVQIGNDIIVPINSGYGFLVGPIAEDRRQVIGSVRVAASLWWMLATVCEQFGRHGLARRHIPPEWSERHIGEAMRQAEQFERWQSENYFEEAVNEVPFMPLSYLGVYGFHAVEDEIWRQWVDLVTTTRRIHQITNGNPWT